MKMYQITSHNKVLRELIENRNQDSESIIVDLDSIDLVIRECLSIEEMREAGSFFTGQELATKATRLFDKAITSKSVILDPTCGAGNLLIECSRMLGVEDTLSGTLAVWGDILRGFDIHESFIEATKLRLIIEALNRGVVNDCTVEEAISYFAQIRAIDALTIKKDDLVDITHVIMNPPFSIWQSPNKYYWKAGKINAAGIVFDHYLRILPKSCSVVAILPEVLRSGSRYKMFRDFCSLKLNAKCLAWGIFNSKTDVDVFLLSGQICDGESSLEIKWQEEMLEGSKLGDYFDVCVGPLVAYRDPLIGVDVPFFHSKNTPAWEIITESNELRRFKGKTINSPFVLIKRTSSPSDKSRATATIINLKKLVAVENHLIVVKPKNNSIKECKKLMRILASDKTNDFLNKRIRLRHLTVQVVKEIPYSP